MTMFDGSLDSQFTMYPEPQRRVIYGYKRSHACVRVLKDEGSTDILIEVLDNMEKRRLIRSVRVNDRGDITPVKS